MKYIHVNQNLIRSNLKNGTNLPVITIKNKSGSKNQYCHELEILGPSKVLSSDNGEPLLSCGARVIIETDSPIKIIK